MFAGVIIVFMIGYMAIELEHPIKIDRAATTLIIGALCWSIYALTPSDILHFSDLDSINTSTKSEQATPGFKKFLVG